MKNDTNSLAHTKWNCKYHIVFAPKYRRKVFYGQKRLEIGAILRSLCEWKEVEIIEAEVCPDHVHMLVSIPPKLSVSGFMGYLKGKSSILIYQKYANMKFKYRNREFWCRGYYVDTVTYCYGHYKNKLFHIKKVCKSPRLTHFFMFLMFFIIVCVARRKQCRLYKQYLLNELRR